jgi:hypothetical protein
MSEIYFNNVVDIGNLYLEKVFTRLEDENILFLCKSENDEKYLCLCYEFRFSLKWILCKITEQNISDLISKAMDIRTVYELSKDKIINIVYKDGIETSEQVDFEAVKDTAIPKKDVYMKEKGELV